jgi:hypothetical protein
VTVCRWELSEATGVTDAGFTEYLVVGGEGDGFGLIAACPMRDDARLIAAAPDMYEALKAILDGVEDESEPGEDMDTPVMLPLTLREIAAALAALAKAEGQS